MNGSRTRRSARGVLLSAVACSALIAGRVAAGPPSDPCTGACARELAAARAATALYQDETAALSDGFVPDPVCAAMPGVGAMGVHYIRFDRASDIDVDARTPEVLLYEPEPDGRRRLVGVEYFAPVLSNGAPWFGSSPPPVVDNPPPVLFGRTFVGPMAGHNPAMPWHYELHVWAWRHNPFGTFAQWNPKVACN